MTLHHKLPNASARFLLGCAAWALLGMSPLALAAEAVDGAAKGPDTAPATGAVQVEMFAAMKSGELEVKFIPKNDREANVILKNTTKRPLSVKLPEAFAGVPVLAQAPGGRRGGGGGGGNQGAGGGMGGAGGGGMGMFNIPPEQVKQVKVDTVCLEHGKKDPRPKVPYEIRPIESFTTKPGVAELCTMLGNGQIDQRAAQAAAWRLNSGMSWDAIAAKRIEHLSGDSEPYFTADQLQMGVAIAEAAVTQAESKARSAQAGAASTATPASAATVSP